MRGRQLVLSRFDVVQQHQCRLLGRGWSDLDLSKYLRSRHVFHRRRVCLHKRESGLLRQRGGDQRLPGDLRGRYLRDRRRVCLFQRQRRVLRPGWSRYGVSEPVRCRLLLAGRPRGLHDVCGGYLFLHNRGGRVFT